MTLYRPTKSEMVFSGLLLLILVLFVMAFRNAGLWLAVEDALPGAKSLEEWQEEEKQKGWDISEPSNAS